MLSDTSRLLCKQKNWFSILVVYSECKIGDRLNVCSKQRLFGIFELMGSSGVQSNGISPDLSIMSTYMHQKRVFKWIPTHACGAAYDIHYCCHNAMKAIVIEYHRHRLSRPAHFTFYLDIPSDFNLHFYIRISVWHWG